MNDTDIIDIVACHPEYDDKLVFRLRNGEFITVEDYISQQVAEQLKQHFGVKQ